MSYVVADQNGGIFNLGGAVMSTPADMLTETAYQEWLDDPEADRCLLVLFDVADGVDTREYRFSSEKYHTEPDDTIHVAFRPFITGSPSFERRIDFLSDEGQSEAGGNADNGVIEINNSDGSLDDLAALEVQKNPITLMLGDPACPYSYFEQFAQTYRIEDVDYTDDEVVRVSLYDRLGELDDPIQGTLLTTGPKTDEPVPDLFGYCRNITPVLIDENNERYKWNSAESEEMLEIYEDGVDNLSHTTYLSLSEITRNTQVRGKITLDGKGHKQNGVWLSSTANIVRYIITGMGPWTDPDDLDTQSFTDFETACPCTIGFYTEATHNNRLDVIEEILGKATGFYTTTLEGKLRIGRYQIPQGLTPVAEFNQNDITQEGFSVLPLNRVRYRTRVGYARNWTVQQRNDLVGSVQEDADRSGWLAEEYRIAKYEEVQTPAKIDPPVENTLFDELVDAQTEAQYRQAILGEQRFICYFEVGAEGARILPGDIIRVFDDRFELSGGKEMQVLSVQVFYLDNIVKIEAWY